MCALFSYVAENVIFLGIPFNGMYVRKGSSADASSAREPKYVGMISLTATDVFDLALYSVGIVGNIS